MLFRLTLATLLALAPIASAQIQYNGQSYVLPVTGQTPGTNTATAVDSWGNAYIADPANNRILKVTVGGATTELIPASTSISGSSLNTPSGIAIDLSGNLYIADTGNNRIVSLALGSTSPVVLATTGLPILKPTHLAVDASANVYISTLNSPIILEVPTTGIAVAVSTLPYIVGNSSALAVDVPGNLYIADSASPRVLKITSGSATLVSIPSLSSTTGIGIDLPGNLYVADSTGKQVGVVPTTGSPYLLNTGSLALTAPTGVVADNNEHLYITDSTRIVAVKEGSFAFPLTALRATPSPTQTLTFAVTPGTTIGATTVLTQSNAPSDFAVSANTCTSAAASTCSLTVTFIPTKPGLRQAVLVIYDNKSNPLVKVPLSGAGSAPAIAFTPGIITTVAGESGVSGPITPGTANALASTFNTPTGVASDDAGNTFVYDDNNWAVRKVTPSGLISTVLGGNGEGDPFGSPIDGDGGLATSATTAAEWGIALDGAGDLFLADKDMYQIREVTAATGIINLIGGKWSSDYQRNYYTGDNGPAIDAYLNKPWGIAVDTAGNTYFSDLQNQVIRKITPAGIITTVAGNEALGAGYSGDNGPATLAQLSYPQGLTFDTAGNLYIADSINQLVRKVDPSGIITTFAGTFGGGGDEGNGGPATMGSLSYPSALAFDGGGNLYIADYYNENVRVVYPNGIIDIIRYLGPCDPPNTTLTCYNGYDQGIINRLTPTTGNLNIDPYGLSSLSTGDLFFSDAAHTTLRKVDISTPPTIGFPMTNLNATTTTEDVAIQNQGNAPLNISAITITAPFAFSSDTTCSTASAFTLQPAQSCTLGVTFTPTTLGAFTGAIKITDNALSTSTSQSIPLNGSTTQLPATILSPTPGTAFTGASVTFTWNPSIPATAYALYIGTALGKSDVSYKSGILGTSLNVTSLPVNGETLYVRLWSFIGGVWQSNDYTYTAAPAVIATLTTPTPSSTLSGSSVTFDWTAGTGTSVYALYVGTSLGAGNIYYASGLSARTLNVPNIPTNGSTLYVRLWSYTSAGWQYHDYTYTTAPAVIAVLTSPTPGSNLTGSSTTFAWSAATGTSGYAFYIGTSVGASNIHYASGLGTTSITIANLPTNGETVYVRLWTFVNTAWQYHDYTYTASGTAPTNGSNK